MRQSELFQELQRIGECLFIPRLLEPKYNKYDKRNSDWRDALKLFLGVYAFERQGRSPDYSHIAIDIIDKYCKENKDCIRDKDLAEKIWDNFTKKVDEINSKSNVGRNPLAPKGTDYRTKKRAYKTKEPSVIEFLMRNLSPDGYNILSFMKRKLQAEGIKHAHEELMKINGIGNKITSLFLRDIMVMEKIKDSQIKNIHSERKYLQPIDVWVRRCNFIISNQSLPAPNETGKKSTEEHAKYIVNKSIEFDVSPEKVNMGMWYLSAQICESYYKLKKVLREGQLRSLVNEHISILSRTVETANTRRLR
jgi:hypothetical protein